MTSKLVVAVLGLLLGLSHCYAQDRGNTEVAIKNLEEQLETALTKGDAATLERILAEDYLEINAQGGIRRKADVIAVARSMSSKSRGVMLGPDKSVDELTVRVYGDSALVVGRTTTRHKVMDYQTSSPQTQTQTQRPEAVDQERFTRTYAKVGGRWRLVAWQTTYIAKQ